MTMTEAELSKALQEAVKPKPKLKKWQSITTTFLGTMFAIAAMSLLMAFPVKWLMNWLFTSNTLQAVFGLGAFSLWKAWGLLFLFGILFGKR